MNSIRAMIWKEVHSFLHDWRILASVVVLVLTFPCIMLFTGLASFLTAGVGLIASSTMAMVLLAYTLTWKSFSYERGEKALTSVLASPISVLEFFLGKSLAVFLFGYPFLLVATIAAAIGLDVKMGAFPGVSDFIMALLAIPVGGLAIIELMGALFLLIGNFDLVRYAGLLLATLIFDITFVQGLGELSDSKVIVICALGGLAISVIIAVVFARVSKTRLAR